MFSSRCKTTLRPSPPLRGFWLCRPGDRARSSGEQLGFYPRPGRSGKPDDYLVSGAEALEAEVCLALLNICGAGGLRLGAAAAAASGETEISFGVVNPAPCQMEMYFMAPLFR